MGGDVLQSFDDELGHRVAGAGEYELNYSMLTESISRRLRRYAGSRI